MNFMWTLLVLLISVKGNPTGCSVFSPCSVGQGDCNVDLECAGDLLCGRDNCAWNNNDEWFGDDCCYDPNANELPCNAEHPAGTGVLGNMGCCSESNLCGVDEGDCDSDSDCQGHLKCGSGNCPWGGSDDCCYEPQCSQEGCAFFDRDCNCLACARDYVENSGGLFNVEISLSGGSGIQCKPLCTAHESDDACTLARNCLWNQDSNSCACVPHEGCTRYDGDCKCLACDTDYTAHSKSFIDPEVECKNQLALLNAVWFVPVVLVLILLIIVALLMCICNKYGEGKIVVIQVQHDIEQGLPKPKKDNQQKAKIETNTPKPEKETNTPKPENEPRESHFEQMEELYEQIESQFEQRESSRRL